MFILSSVSDQESNLHARVDISPWFNGAYQTGRQHFDCLLTLRMPNVLLSNSERAVFRKNYAQDMYLLTENANNRISQRPTRYINEISDKYWRRNLHEMPKN